MNPVTILLSFAGFSLMIWGRYYKAYSRLQQSLFLCSAILLMFGALFNSMAWIVADFMIIVGCILGFFTVSKPYKLIAIGITAILCTLLLWLDQPPSALLITLAAVFSTTGFAIRSAPIQLLSALLFCGYYDLQFIDGSNASAVFVILNLIFAILAIRSIWIGRQQTTRYY